MEHREHSLWRPVWRAPFVNPTMPVTAVVSNTGQAATFDDWYMKGFGRNAVVIYDERGRKIRNLALLDFLPRVYVDALPQSVSSIWWDGEHRFSLDSRQLILQVIVPTSPDTSWSPDSRHFVEVALDTSNGQLIPPQGATWEHALQAAKTSYAELKRRAAQAIAGFEAPLTAPANDDVEEWRRYIEEAYWRINPEWTYDPTHAWILPREADKHYAKDLQWITQRFPTSISPDDMVLLASPDAENLIRVLSSITGQMPPQTLRDMRVCIAVPADLREAAAKALAGTGATFVPLDTDKPLAQPPRRLLQHYFSRLQGGPP